MNKNILNDFLINKAEIIKEDNYVKVVVRIEHDALDLEIADSKIIYMTELAGLTPVGVENRITKTIALVTLGAVKRLLHNLVETNFDEEKGKWFTITKDYGYSDLDIDW